MRRFNPEKELRKIQHARRDKLFIGVFLILLIISISSTYALYQVRYSKRIIYTKVAPFSSKDLDLAIYVDGSKVEKVPEKGKGYYYESITCESDPSAIAGWDYTNWKLGAISVTVPNKCNINFTSHPTTLIEQIKYVKGVNSDMVVDDETQDHNLRYIGANPDNYIWFNCDNYDGLTSLNASDNEHRCEKWRIIGLFNDINKPDETKEDLVKIIRDESIGGMAWGSSNNWATSSLQASLNGTYYNGNALGSGKGITQQTQEMIENVRWNIGSYDSSSTTTSQFYIAERGNSVSSGAPAVWNGHIALMYASDYGYATSGSKLSDDLVTNRDGCLAYGLGGWGNGNYQTNCAGNDWLFDPGVFQWTLSTRGPTYSLVFPVHDTGVLGNDTNYSYWSAYAVRPALYLKSNIGVAGGDGSSETPYVLIS